MATTADLLPDDTEALKAALIEARAKLAGAQALIEHLQLAIAKMQREKFGPRSERGSSISWNCSSRNWRRQSERTKGRPRRRACRCEVSRGGQRRGATFLPICRVGALF